MTEKLIHRIDCTQEAPAETYFAHGEEAVRETRAGRYREAGDEPLSRFGYRFTCERIGQPHVAVIRYPDDKRRFMCIMDGTTYDLTTGVVTGWEQPLTDRMIELRQVFWPRWRDCSIVFMTWGEGEPAAVADIEIRELDALPALDVPGDPGDGSRREFGIQYEDPCGTGASEGAVTREEWIDRLVAYARHTGQNLLTYPMAWYHGPLFPSDREPTSAFTLRVAPDRTQYASWSARPGDWYGPLLERFEKEGLQFEGALTLMRLGSLLEHMNIDLDAIRAGRDTYNNMMWDGRVQSSTNDWTPIYNARNFSRIAESLRPGEKVTPFGTLGEYAYGEKPARGFHTAPLFNPLHPTVQETILGFVRELGARYGQHPAFRGISFNMFASAMPWFGSIHAGYDDHTVARFQEETGIAVPVDPGAPDRFSKRYEFLTFVCRPAWVAWRCRRIRDLFGRIQDALRKARPDLRVTITLWDETVVINTLGSMTAGHQWPARTSMLEFYREAGIDPALYDDAPGIAIDLAVGNTRDRGGHGSSPTGGVTLPLEELSMYRDFDYLDAPCMESVAKLEQSGAFIFNCWVEAWGTYTWSLPEPNDPHAAAFRDMDGGQADGVVVANSEYPPDAFWWDSQSRITPAFPSGVHFLEPYAHAVAELDACRITSGGLFLDKAHGEAQRRFARAFRALPAEPFTPVGDRTDPVAVRSAIHEGKRYFYAVNREYYPVPVTIRFNAPPEGLTNLATGDPLDAPETWSIVLGPYELRSFAAAAAVGIASFHATPPEEVRESLIEGTDRACEAIATVRRQNRFVPGMDALEHEMRAAVKEGRVAWLRRALSSYVVRKCLDLHTE